MERQQTVTAYRFIAGLALISALAGCVSNSPSDSAGEQGSEYVFFPPEPDEPRVQFLCSLSGSQDVEPGRSGFQQFILGEDVESPRTISKPFGVVMRDGRLMVADTRSKSIAVLDFKNKKFESFGTSGAGRLRTPINLRIDSAGRCYVADRKRSQIVVFDSEGKYETAYGKEDEFGPADVLVDEKHNEMYVLNIDNHEVQVYDLATQELKRTLGKRGSLDGEFNYPTNMAMDAAGDLYISDSVNFRVQKIDREGNFLMKFGQVGQTPGHFARPKGIAVARDGLIHVVDATLNVVQIFSTEGDALTFFGGAGTEPGQLLLPAQIHLDYDNIELFRKYISPDFKAEYLMFVTNQMGDSKVSVFAFGRRKSANAPKSQ